MDVLSLLPLLNGWEYVNLSKDISITAGGSETLFESDYDENGWLLGARIYSNVSDVDLHIFYEERDTGRSADFHLNPNLLLGLGWTAPNQVLPFVDVYDDISNRYSAMFTPNPAFSIRGKMTITIKGGSSDANVKAEVALVRVTDMEDFIGSLRGLLAPGIPRTAPAEVPQLPTAGEYKGFLP